VALAAPQAQDLGHDGQLAALAQQLLDATLARARARAGVTLVPLLLHFSRALALAL
jgi:hypothetical protein